MAALKERPLFIMEKSHNEQNTMVIYAQTNSECEFKAFDSGSYLDYYWLMGGKKRKRVHPLIKKGIADRIEFKKSKKSDEKEFKAVLNDLDEVKNDLPNTEVKITSVKNGNDCSTLSTIMLGKSNKYKTIELEKTYCEVDKIFGVPKGCKRLDLQGKDLKSRKRIKASYYEN